MTVAMSFPAGTIRLEPWSRSSAFKSQSDGEIWRPRHDQQAMAKLETEAGWKGLCADLDLLQRDSLILLRNS